MSEQLNLRALDSYSMLYVPEIQLTRSESELTNFHPEFMKYKIVESKNISVQYFNSTEYKIWMSCPAPIRIASASQIQLEFVGHKIHCENRFPVNAACCALNNQLLQKYPTLIQKSAIHCYNKRTNIFNTAIPRLTKIIRSGITFVSRNVISRRFQ